MSSERKWAGWPRAVDRAFLLASLLLGSAGLAAWAVGGGAWRLGPLVIGLQRPLRTVALSCGLLLLREALRDRAGGRACLRSLALLAALVAALALDSTGRIVGDGQEYLAMAWNLGQGRPPALSAAERVEVERLLGLGDGELGAGRELLRGADERQDFHHFWLFPLLAAPFLPLVRASGGTVFTAFTLLNGALLLGSAALVCRRLGPGALPVLFCGPLLWWLDKPHPEILLVALLAAAFSLADSQRGAALLLLGLAAAQNPVFWPLLAIASLWAVSGSGPARPRVAVLVAAWALAAANPLYFLHHLGRPVPLGDTVLLHRPGWAELRAVLIDPNLGLLPAWPSLGLLALLAAAASLRRWRSGNGVPWRDAAALVLAFGTLLFAFTLPGNINHGGTRGMSRYALWLVPFAIPALATLRGGGAGVRVALVLLGAGSLFSTLPDYLPSRPERYLEPTPFAAWLWTRHPGSDRPLPEVFAERAWGYPPLGSVPAGLPECELALVGGDGSPLGRWPLPCAPVEKPAFCRTAATLCYARPDEGGRTGFAPAPRQPTFPGNERGRWYWSGTPAPGLVAAMRSLPWRDLGIVAASDERAFFAERRGCGRLELRTAAGAYLAWFDGVRREGAYVVPIVRERRTAILVDPSSGEELSRTDLEPAASVAVALPRRGPLLLVVSVSS